MFMSAPSRACVDVRDLEIEALITRTAVASPCLHAPESCLLAVDEDVADDLDEDDDEDWDDEDEGEEEDEAEGELGWDDDDDDDDDDDEDEVDDEEPSA